MMRYCHIDCSLCPSLSGWIITQQQSRKVLKALAISGFVIFINLFMQAAAAAEKTLTILNWSEYIDPDLIQRFEHKYQTKVIEVYYKSSQHCSEMLLQNDAKGYDLILSAGIDLRNYIKRGWLAKIDEQKLAFLPQIKHKWRNAYPGAKDHAIPYFWGTLGIIYRHDLVKEPITKWSQLYSHSAELKGDLFAYRAT